MESWTKGRVKLKNNKTDKILSSTYHASNLNMYLDEEAPPSPQSPDDLPSDFTNDTAQSKRHSNDHVKY